MSSGEERAVEPAESRDVSPASHGSFGRASPMLRPDSALKSSASSAELRPRGHSDDDSDSEVSDSESFLSKGAFLLTPAGELNMEKASAICEKMNFKGPFSLTKTATGILFKFAEPEDYQATFKKGFSKVTGARFYRKVRQFKINCLFALFVKIKVMYKTLSLKINTNEVFKYYIY